MTKVVNSWLLATSVYGKYDAFEIAFKRLDTDTIRLLENIATIPPPTEGSDEFSSIAYMATEALVGVGAWPSVVRAATCLGMNGTPRSASAATEGQVCLLDVAMSSAIVAFEKSSGRHPGALIALGVGGRSDYLGRILAVLATEDSASNVARACIVALSVLDDPGGLATDALVRQLPSGQSRYAATLGLLRNPNPRGLVALATLLSSNFDVSLAASLVKHPETHDMALNAMRRALEQGGFGAEGLLQSLQRYDSGQEIDLVLNTDDLRRRFSEQAYALEGGVWYIGSKASIMSALAGFDSNTAFDAALYALKNPESHDRQLYPYLLVEIDADRATGILSEMICTEDSAVMQAAVGRSLAQVPDLVTPLIHKWLASDLWQRRLGACRLAAYQPVLDGTWAAVRSCLEDERRSVMEAAEKAVWQMTNSRWCWEIIEAFAAESAADRRWRLLDSALAVGDPGDVNRPWPDWLAQMCEGLPYFWIQYINEALKKNRESRLKEAQDQDNDCRRD